MSDSVIDEVTAWPARPLESSYAGVFFDGLGVKIRDDGLVKNMPVTVATGIRPSSRI